MENHVMQYQTVHFTLNGKAASVAVGPEEIPALGEVTLT